MGRRTSIALAAACLVAAGCSTSEEPPRGTAPSPSVSTLTPVPLPEHQPSGRLLADVRQSSRDLAAGQMQVWLDNDTARDLTPSRITYRDPRFGDPVPGERLRPVPAGSERGFPLRLPRRPACHAHAVRPRLEVTWGGRTRVVRVTDPTDVAGRWVATRCQEISLAEVARLRFADRVPVDRPGPGSTGALVLVVEPTGRTDRALVVDSITGTPLLTPAGRGVWRPPVQVDGPGPVQRFRLPVRPARCDDHVFMESGGATAFKVNLRLDGRPGQVLLRMSPAGASAAIAFARDSCGLG